MAFTVAAIMIVAFVLVYGEREYVIDLAQLYPIEDGDRFWSSPAHPAQLRNFVVAECASVAGILVVFTFKVLPPEGASPEDVLDTLCICALIGAAFAMILGFLVYNAYGSIRRAEVRYSVFFPSYRVAFFGADEQTDQLVSVNKTTGP
ncbi:hypothetical protein ANCCAN_15944 [Ancylostoma caninum]|uniref:Uncharacterized protein n=1 Tax=Ancylostoma caninum TaxID=29170 RepID=A0A368G125_ANCCA|nr:hypothetical protein ANCCAN_15944 [Ancylostoma caninum]